MLKRDKKDEGKDTRMRREIRQLINTISQHEKVFGLKSFTTGVARGSKTRTGDGDGASASGGDASAAESAELKAHGYEVKPEVIVDSSGVILEPLFKVWQLFPTLSY